MVKLIFLLYIGVEATCSAPEEFNVSYNRRRAKSEPIYLWTQITKREDGDDVIEVESEVQDDAGSGTENEQQQNDSARQETEVLHIVQDQGQSSTTSAPFDSSQGDTITKESDTGVNYSLSESLSESGSQSESFSTDATSKNQEYPL